MIRRVAHHVQDAALAPGPHLKASWQGRTERGAAAMGRRCAGFFVDCRRSGRSSLALMVACAPESTARDMQATSRRLCCERRLRS